MKYILNNISINIDKHPSDLKEYIAKLIGINQKEISSLIVIKKSIDARRKSRGILNFIYSIEVQINKSLNMTRLKKSIDIREKNNKDTSTNSNFSKGDKRLRSKPIVVGSGPAGLFATLTLAEHGYNPILFERGKDVDSRSEDVNHFWENGIIDSKSNVQFGEGGAGTFSDGKLTTRIKDDRCRKVLEYMVDEGAPQEILYLQKPHLGTDILKRVVKNIRKRIIDLGGEVFFEHQVTNMLVEKGRVSAVEVNNNLKYNSDVVVLAIGHSARDTYKMLYENNVNVISKPFAIGVRIEHPQEMIDMSQYGKYSGHPLLKAAEYHLTYQDKETGRSVYTFCMCPGGRVIGSSSEEGGIVTNGMSNFARDLNNANSAVVVSVTTEDFESDHPLAGIEFQRKYERLAFELGGKNYYAPIQLVGDFLKNKESVELGEIIPSYTPGYKLTNLKYCLPDYVIKSIRNAMPFFNNKLKGFSREDAILTGVETRTSSPIRILRDKETKESVNVKGLYPIGEGAGYAGGIMSAAVDGIRAAERILMEYRSE